MSEEPTQYLGDGVYVTFDGYHIWLLTGSHDDPDNRVALDPHVLDALDKFRDRLGLGHSVRVEKP